jgi:hypothetical protein
LRARVAVTATSTRDAFRRALLVVGAVWLAGCAIGTQRFGRPIDAHLIASVQVGLSTKADVLRDFGPPTSYAKLPVVPDVDSGASSKKEAPLAAEEEPPQVFVYEYREDRENFFTVLLFTRFRREVLSDRLMVFFDPADVVRYVAFTRETREPKPE